MGPRLLKKKQLLQNNTPTLMKKLIIARKKCIRMEQRFIRAQNSILSLENEKSELLERNSKILESYQAQKLESAARQKEVFDLRKLLHDAHLTINSNEIKLQDSSQVITSSLKEIDVMFPHLVSLSQSLASNKLRLKDLRASLPITSLDHLPRLSPEELSLANSTKSNFKPTKHRVGPMVKGMLITKPKIVLERLMLPQQQDQEHVNNEEGVPHQLSPVQEENPQELAMRNVTDRPNKRRLGRGKRSLWRMNNTKDPLERKKTEKERLAPAINYISSSDSGESDSDHPSPTRGLMEPVVRIRDVSRLLQNSSLIKVDTEKNCNSSEVKDKTDSKITSRRVARTLPPTNHEDPLEGSSWMFQNVHSYRSRKRNKLDSSLDFSDDENVVAMDPIYPVNSNFEVHRKSSYSSSQRRNSESPAQNALNEAEPDSTSIEIGLRNHSEDAISSSSSVESLSRSFPDDSKCQTLIASQLNTCNIVPTSASTPFEPAVNHSLSTNSLDRSSLGPSPSFDTIPFDKKEKRVRKPKIFLYPGESDSSAETKENIQSKKKKKVVDKKKPKLTTRRKSSSSNSTKKAKLSSGKNSVLNKDSRDEKKPKESTKKRSLITPRNSSISDSLLDFQDASRSSRRKQNVTYKEPSLSKKMRQP